MYFFFFQAEDGTRDVAVTGVQTCALPIWPERRRAERRARARRLGASAPRRDRAAVRTRGCGARGRVLPPRSDPGDRARHAPADRPLPPRPWRDRSAPRRLDGRGDAPRDGRRSVPGHGDAVLGGAKPGGARRTTLSVAAAAPPTRDGSPRGRRRSAPRRA